jgi:hypothetical protein
MRQRAVLNDEIRRGARRYLDRKARRRIAVQNVPIPDRLDEVGDSGGGPDAPRKAFGNDVFAAAIGWLQLPLRKTDRLCRYHEKAPCCGKSRKKPKPNATPHPALGAFGGFPWLFLVAIITVETFRHEAAPHAGPHRPENPQESLGKTPSPGRGAARHHADTLDRHWYSVANRRPSDGANVRVGSIASLWPSAGRFGSSPINGHSQSPSTCLLRVPNPDPPCRLNVAGNFLCRRALLFHRSRDDRGDFR